jgi:hypothetical protein
MLLSVHAANNNGAAAVRPRSSLDCFVSMFASRVSGLSAEPLNARGPAIKLYAITVHSIHQPLGYVPNTAQG